MIYFKSMKKTAKTIFSIVISLIILLSVLPFKAYAEEADLDAVIEERKNIPVESNMITGWPVGPKTGAQSAILIDANTGIVLYSKNIHEKLYPASITKILTALIAYENCDMNDMVTFSYDAVSSIDWRYDANMGINAGDSIPMEQALYGMLVGSANEAAYAIAEHVSGNIEDFAVLMNTKARELGCTDSHFVTPNGIHDEDHYTSAHDMALIAKAFFANDFLANISRTPSYQVPQTATQPNDNMIVYAKSKLFPGKEYALTGLVGTKTGYTDSARQTLVTCAENDSLRLICVVMKEEDAESIGLSAVGTIKLQKSGSCELDLLGEESKGKWKKAKNGTITITYGDDMTLTGSIDDKGVMTLTDPQGAEYTLTK